MKQDILVKRANYISKNNDLTQEFHFCHPVLFCRESKMLENSWNTSFIIMYDLPYATHRFFVESVSGQIHLKNILMKRFLGFLSQIEKSSKKLPLKLLNVVKHDARSTTGSNLRNIMLSLDKASIRDISAMDI